uniref:Secreted protein n=1 Tax=Loa loa TaxID=7209 RepID=A0A1I7VKE7_LOALO
MAMPRLYDVGWYSVVVVVVVVVAAAAATAVVVTAAVMHGTLIWTRLGRAA